jgi:hypothetical protein
MPKQKLDELRPTWQVRTRQSRLQTDRIIGFGTVITG